MNSHAAMNAPTPARPPRRYPLYVHLSALFSTLVLAAGASVAWLGYVESRDIALSAADEVFRHIGRETQSSLTQTLQPVRSFAELLALQPIAHARTLNARLEALPVMARALAGDAPTAAVYVGYDDGSFFLVRPLLNATQRAAFAAPEAAALLVESIEVVAGGARRPTFLFLNEALREIGRRTPSDLAFDPRARPWYRLAAEPGKRVLTEPYVFATAHVPGVTVAVRTNSFSVVGVDVTLQAVSERLAALRTTPGMRIALFDSQRRLLARADVNRSMVRAEGDRVSLATLDQFGEPVLAALQPARPEAGGVSAFTLEADGRDWKAVVLPISTARGTLSLGIALPLDELLRQARALRMRGLLTTVAVLLLAIPLTWWAAHRVAQALRGITREAEDIRAFRFDGAQAGPSIVLEVDQLAGAMGMMRGTIRRFLDIATSLAAETNFQRLLDRVVRETSSATGAAGGLLYLTESDSETLAPASLVRADGQGLEAAAPKQRTSDESTVAQACRSGNTVVTRVGAQGARAARGFEFVAGLWPGTQVGVVAIPLRDRSGETVGVLVLFSPGEEPIGEARLAFAEALSGTAAVAIETQRLLQARKALLDSFIHLVAGAIDAKSPYTGGHCQRVPELTLMLARAACAATHGPFADFDLSEEQWEALQIASWLHDCGKVTTPEYVVDKATKLETIHDRIHEIRMRFEVLKRDAQVEYWQHVAGGGDGAALRVELEAGLAKLDQEFAFVASCNEGGEFMDAHKVERLREISRRTWLRTLDDRIGISHDEQARKERNPAPALPAVERLLDDKPEHAIERTQAERMPDDNRWGFKLQVPELKYNRGELHNLCIARGTLTEEERYVINHHIVQTIVMLSQLPFPRHLAEVPRIAGGHHEKMDGTGYPMQLKRDQMGLTARMMAIADIFEALTAADRPYKKGKTVSEALKIMSFMKRDQHIDPDLFDLFLTSCVYRHYAERFLPPAQIDAVDVSVYLGGAQSA